MAGIHIVDDPSIGDAAPEGHDGDAAGSMTGGPDATLRFVRVAVFLVVVRIAVNLVIEPLRAPNTGRDNGP